MKKLVQPQRGGMFIVTEPNPGPSSIGATCNGTCRPDGAFFARRLTAINIPLLRSFALWLGAGLLLAGLVLRAAEKVSLPPETATFKAGPGVEIAMGQCLVCHSADYVSTQPRLARAAWRAAVLKMRDKYGAPLPEDKVEALVDYLVKTYGAEAPK